MPKAPQGLTKIAIRIFDEDLERLKKYYPEIGYNVAIRTLVTQHLNKLDKLHGVKAPELPAFEGGSPVDI